MINQVLADTGRIYNNGNIKFFEVRRRANTRQHKQLGTTNSASTQHNLTARSCFNNFAVSRFILDSGRGNIIQQNFLNLSIGYNFKVFSTLHRIKISRCCTTSLSIVNTHVQNAKTLLTESTNVIGQRIPGFFTRVNKCLIYWVFWRWSVNI